VAFYTTLGHILGNISSILALLLHYPAQVISSA
jgi:hypothetical protein